MASARRFCWPNDIASGGRSRTSSRSARDVRRNTSSTSASNVSGSRPEHAWSEEQLLFDRPSEQHLARALEHVAERFDQVGRAPVGDRPAVDEDRSAADAEQSHGRAEQGGLARAVRPEDRDGLRGAQPGIDPEQDLGIHDRGRDIPEFETWRTLVLLLGELRRRPRRRSPVPSVVCRPVRCLGEPLARPPRTAA